MTATSARWHRDTRALMRAQLDADPGSDAHAVANEIAYELLDMLDAAELESEEWSARAVDAEVRALDAESRCDELRRMFADLALLGATLHELTPTLAAIAGVLVDEDHDPGNSH